LKFAELLALVGKALCAFLRRFQLHDAVNARTYYVPADQLQPRFVLVVRCGRLTERATAQRIDRRRCRLGDFA